MLTSHPVKSVHGMIRAPGDKSCSHRALILGALAHGMTSIEGLLQGEDVLHTADSLKQMGADIQVKASGQWEVQGVGAKGLGTPAGALDFGNSGTGARLIMGAMSGFDLQARLTGDASLSARPMQRVTDPLSQMGAAFRPDEDMRLPMYMQGTASLRAIDYTPPHASAQVKSAILLAGLQARGTTIVREMQRTRDHTERMLRAFGAEVNIVSTGKGQIISLPGPQSLTGQATLSIPGDPSSAAFLAAAALISPKGHIHIEHIMSNETRDGFFRMVEKMGGRLGAEATGEAAGERIIDIETHSAELSGISVPEAFVPSMIDEFPILAVLAAYAKGETIVTGAGELRVKEADRIRAIVNMLRVNGVNAEERPDGFIIEGCAGPPPGGGLVQTHHDHRIAMSALILGSAAKLPVRIDDARMIKTSYPNFLAHMDALGLEIS